MRIVSLAPLLACALGLLPSSASAQVLTLTWQMQPFCNKVTVTLTGTPAGFALTGFDDLCGEPRRASVVGTAVLNPDGTAGVNFVVVPSPGGAGVQVAGVVNPGNGQGSWSDSLGNSGTFALGGAAPGLPARPIRPVVLQVANGPDPNVDPCLSTPMPTLVFCGSSAGRWTGDPSEDVQVWRDAAGLVHIRGRIARSAAPVQSSIIFTLPEGLRPPENLLFSVGVSGLRNFNGGAGTAIIVVLAATNSAPGQVQLVQSSISSIQGLTFGEIIFSVDR